MSTMFRLTGRGVLAASLMLAMGAQAVAGSVTYGPVSIGPATTNWSSSIALPQWDPLLFPGQVLTGISFSLFGEVVGNAQFESLDSQPATVSMNLVATITLTDPSSNVLATVIPVASTLDTVTAFDGVIDFGGTSGKSYTGLYGSASDSGSSMDFATFTGSGFVVLPVSAAGSSFGSGAGNLITSFSTSAAASASVTYYYEAIPEASSLALLGACGAVCGLALARRRRRTA